MKARHELTDEEESRKKNEHNCYIFLHSPRMVSIFFITSPRGRGGGGGEKKRKRRERGGIERGRKRGGKGQRGRGWRGRETQRDIDREGGREGVKEKAGGGGKKERMQFSRRDMSIQCALILIHRHGQRSVLISLTTKYSCLKADVRGRRKAAAAFPVVL